MISSLDVNVDILSEMLGIVVEKKNPAPKEGQSLKLYIPTLMPDIEMPDVTKLIPYKYTNFINTGNKLFINDIECRPRCRLILRTQNYITGYLEKNTKWINYDTSEVRTREAENEYGYKINASGKDALGLNVKINLYEEYKSYYTMGGEKVDCYAPNGKLSKLIFNNDKYI